MKLKVKLPKEIFVKWDGAIGEQYLDARETAKGFEDGDQIGIYKLIALKRQKITEELV